MAHSRWGITGVNKYLLAVLLILASLHCGSVVKQELPWPERPYPYLVVKQDVREILESFGRTMEIRVVMSEDVAGIIDRRVSGTTAAEFLDSLSDAGELSWYGEEDAVYIGSNRFLVRESFDSSAYGEADVHRAVADLQKNGSGISAVYNAATRQVTAVGIKPYISLVRRTIGRLAMKIPSDHRGSSVRIFRGTSSVELVSFE